MTYWTPLPNYCSTQFHPKPVIYNPSCGALWPKSPAMSSRVLSPTIAGILETWYGKERRTIDMIHLMSIQHLFRGARIRRVPPFSESSPMRLLVVLFCLLVDSPKLHGHIIYRCGVPPWTYLHYWFGEIKQSISNSHLNRANVKNRKWQRRKLSLLFSAILANAMKNLFSRTRCC